MVCCFFGHRDVPDGLSEKLCPVLEKLISEGVDTFLVGNQGGFDRMVLGTLRQIKVRYPHISYYVVLAYMPGARREVPQYTPEETLYPEGLESVPPRYAISWRNNWLLRNADVIVAYVTHTWGGAANFTERASRKGIRVINISN